MIRPKNLKKAGLKTLETYVKTELGLDGAGKGRLELIAMIENEEQKGAGNLAPKTEPLEQPEQPEPLEHPATQEEPEQPEPPEVKYSHESARRCTGVSRSYPAFMNRKCGALMEPNGTRNGGQYKRWKCPSCNATAVTEGKPV
jgi:hypothetical protein